MISLGIIYHGMHMAFFDFGTSVLSGELWSLFDRVSCKGYGIEGVCDRIADVRMYEPLTFHMIYATRTIIN